MKENKCSHLVPKNIPLLPEKDGFRIIYEKQANLQEKLGRLALARSRDMHGKCSLIMEEIFCMNSELAEMLDRLPFKHWNKYTKRILKDWESKEVREETLMEYIDAFHFFLNIGLILGFTSEEVFYYYEAKNKENHRRQKEGY